MPIWRNLIILILYPNPILQLVFCVLRFDQRLSLKQHAKFHGMEATFKFLALAFSQVFMILYNYNNQLAELFCLSIQIYKAKLFFILIAFDLKELQIICKPMHMKCFQTIFSNSYLLTSSSSYFFPDVALARLGLMFTCRKNILFYVEFSSLPFSS